MNPVTSPEAYCFREPNPTSQIQRARPANGETTEKETNLGVGNQSDSRRLQRGQENVGKELRDGRSGQVDGCPVRQSGLGRAGH